MASMGKKKIVDMVAYFTILLHNNRIDDIMDDEQIKKMMDYLIEKFDNDEEKVLKFIQKKVKSFLIDLEENTTI